MAKAATQRLFEESERAEPVTETITYIPGEGDKVSVTWCGHVFHANVPKDITGCATGSDRERLNMQLIERARENKHFVVGGAKKKRDAFVEPKTTTEYRAYASEWIKDASIQHADALIERLARDRALQTACEVGYDDFQYLATLFMPRLHQLAKGDELNEMQVSSLWIGHGYNVLPW